MAHPKLATARSSWGGRGYYIPGHIDAAGARRIYPSVTTVLKRVAKPGLHQWIADQTAAYAVANLPYLMRVSEEKGWGYLRWYWSREPDLVATELRTWHEGVRDDAGELGTNLHEWLEADLDGTVEPVGLNAEEAREMAEQFHLWLRTHRIEVRRTEFTIVNTVIGYAGTADAHWLIACDHEHPCLGQERGVFVSVLVDLKTSRYTWPEHGMQLAALSDANVVMREVVKGYAGSKMHEATVDGKRVRSWWVEEEPPTYQHLAVLHLRPTDLDPSGETIPAFCELVDFTRKQESYRKGFAGAHALAEMFKELG